MRLDWIGSEWLSWRDLKVIVHHAQIGSPLAVAMGGERADWTRVMQMLADIWDAVAAGNWQRGGGKGPKPKPYPRPTKKDTTRIGSDPLPLDEMAAWLGWN